MRSALPSPALGILLCLALLPCFGAGPQARTARSLPELKNLFRRSCAGCHGADGTATEPGGRRLKGRDFTSAQAMAGRTDRQLEATIRRGLASGLRMPAFRSELTPEEIRIMVRDIVRKAEKGKPIGSPPGP